MFNDALLRGSVQKIKERQNLSDSDAFIVHCLTKILLIEEQVAKGYITDGPNDGNIDAFYYEIDEVENEIVLYILNCKYPKEGSSHSISEREVRLLSDSLRKIIKGETFANLKEDIKKKLEEISILIEQGYSYRMEVYFICSGSTPASESVKAQALKFEDAVIEYHFWSLEDTVKNLNGKKRTVILDIQKERMKFQIEDADMKSMVAVLPAASVIKLYEEGGKDRILDQNVRGYLGSNSINKKIIESANHSNELANYFLIFNNGISVVCDFYETIEFSGITQLKIENPQIINGGQTTKALYSLKEGNNLSEKISVFARIYETRKEELIDKIRESTNTQNSISLRDLKSTHSVQKRVKEYFGNKGVFLDIKRERNAREKEKYQESILNDTLLQAYVSFYKDLPHRAKSSRAWVFKKYFDEVFTENTSDKLLKELYLSYQIWRFCLLKEEEEKDIAKRLLLQYGSYTIIYTMGQIEPKIKKIDIVKEKKSLKDFAGINEIHKKTVALIQELVQAEQKRLQASYSHNNFFKSTEILVLINQKIT